MDDFYDFEDEGAGYDSGTDFGVGAPEDDNLDATGGDSGRPEPASALPEPAGADASPPRPPVQLVRPATSSTVGWALSDVNETGRLLQLLPPPAKRKRHEHAASGRDRAGARRAAPDGDRPGDRLAREVALSDLLPALGWELDGETADGGSRWIRPDHSEPYDGSHDATVYLDEDGIERITVFSERQRAAWGLTDGHSCSSFDLLTQVFSAGDAHLAAAVARLVLAEDVPVERLGELLHQDDTGPPGDVAERLRAAVGAAPASTSAAGSRTRVHTALVDWENECIKASNEPTATILVDAGLRIVGRVVVNDDLNPATPTERLYDVEVRLDGAQYVVRDVYSTDLGQPRSWLDRLPDAVSDEIVISPARQVEIEIEAALRTQMKLDRPTVYRALRRIGWAAVGDRIGYVTTQGSLTVSGLDESLRAVVTGPPAAVALTEPDPAILADDVRTVLSISGPLSESGKTALVALFSAMAWAHSGVTPPAAGLVIVGEKGSGKTALVRHALSALSPDPDSLLTSLDSSAGVVGEVGAGAHNGIAWVEDARDKPSERIGEEQSAAIDSLLRRTYGGGVVGRARLRPDGHGRFIRQDPDRSSPMALITAEKLPSSTTISSLERCLTVALLAKAPDEEPFDDRLRHLLRDGALRRTWGAFICHLAALIDALAPGDPEAALAAWRAHLANLHSEMVLDLLASGQLTIRQAQVAAGFLTGWRLWSEFCIEAGELDSSEALSLASDGQLRLSESARRHAVGVMDPGEVGPMAVVNRLRQATLGERWWIDGPGFPVPADVSRVELLGQVVKERESGTIYVALLHDVAAKAIGMRSGLELVASLGELVARARSGQRTRPTRVRGTVIRTVWIPLDIWEEGSDTGDSDRHPTSDDADEDF